MVKVYISPFIYEAEEYSGKPKGIFLNNIQYNIIFMYRINLFKIRIVDKEIIITWLLEEMVVWIKMDNKISERM